MIASNHQKPSDQNKSRGCAPALFPCLCEKWIYMFISKHQQSLLLLKTRTNCSVETMLRRTRWISDGTFDKMFFEKMRIWRAWVALKTIWSYCTLINIKPTYPSASNVCSYVLRICVKGEVKALKIDKLDAY